MLVSVQNKFNDSWRIYTLVSDFLSCLAGIENGGIVWLWLHNNFNQGEIAILTFDCEMRLLIAILGFTSTIA